MVNLNRVVRTTAGAAVIAACAFGVTTSSHAQLPNQPGFGAPRINQMGKHHGERHPELRRALGALKRADMNLRAAKTDFSGHREQALDLTEKAIDQVQQALASDRK